MTLTKEWLLKTIAELEEERDATPGAVNEDAARALAAMKRALASLEARSRKLFTCSACGAEGLDEPLESKCHCNEDGAHWIESVVYTAPPAPEFYKIGDATMRHIFTPTGITDVSDMQAVFDQIETVLAGMWQPAPVSVPDEEQCKPHPVMAVKGELGFLDHFDRIISERDEDIDIGQLGSSNYEALMLAALDAFRAAMFQGAERGSNRDELTDAVNGLLAVMDEYPETLVPINRDSAVVRQLRVAAGD
ncbi:hypothetical protein QIV32_05110 [Enterobacter ludwigii]|uniref:hypothetical protein n=1 Tax=Enterobacter ludwigii TaxID=299767 RepID=UPI00234C6271|nr:hypothetical protein [Enterobacter ludwigii]MDC7312681.1 hypothetical protein [Enterobacter ludwigii]MDI0402733.1 hypothetical protein [Enterobacter ludwigii]MDI0410632.1 hypothetical protein [Enterobacter ludwigii]MDI0417746.1 hypothetical protein [Enterobacter ludwigii]MDI0427777.1 hypothetical protein [Enterobacter ludwigii]